MVYQFITTELAENNVLTITLARPEKRNAMHDPMYEELVEVIRDAATNSGVRSVMVAAQGRDFSAGNDIGDFESINDGAASAAVGPGDVLIHELVAFEKPVVAAVRGRGIGFGTTMLLHADLVYVAPDVRLRAPFTTLALTPEAGSSLLLPLAIGAQRAFAMFALGDVLDATSAVELGLAYKVVDSDQLEATARAAAGRLADLSMSAVAATKRLTRRAAVVCEQVTAEEHEFYKLLLTPEAKESFAAFRDHRTPDYRGTIAAL